MSSAERLDAVERLACCTAELVRTQAEEIAELRSDLAQTRAELRQVSAVAAGARYLAGAALDA